MSYSEDMRCAAIRFIDGGGSKVEAARVYGVSRSTVYEWVKRRDDLKPRKPGVRLGSGRKLDRSVLLRVYHKEPDRTLQEYAVMLSSSRNAVWHAFKTLGITRKKNVAVS